MVAIKNGSKLGTTLFAQSFKPLFAAVKFDLEKITKNIERDYKPANINLTSYEQEQEDNAIISYQELLNSKDKNHVNYDGSFNNKTDIDIKKVDLSNNEKNGYDEHNQINITLMSYEKEEAFLKALKQLKIDLAR